MPNNQNENSPRTKNAPDELPPPDTKRWTPRRKAGVVNAVLSGLNTIEEVCRRYDLTVEEFRWWQNMMQKAGARGLHTTKLQKYRFSRPKEG